MYLTADYFDTETAGCRVWGGNGCTCNVPFCGLEKMPSLAVGVGPRFRQFRLGASNSLMLVASWLRALQGISLDAHVHSSKFCAATVTVTATCWKES